MEQHIKIRFDLHGNPVSGESVWAMPITENLFRLANIPFYAVGYAEGDTVRTMKRNDWDQVVGLEHDSGNGTLRLMFADSESPEAQHVLEELVSVGCRYERASSKLVAVTVPSTLQIPFSQLANYLNSISDDFLPGWEIGKRLTRPAAPTDTFSDGLADEAEE